MHPQAVGAASVSEQTCAGCQLAELGGLAFVNDCDGPSPTNDGDSTKVMARRHPPDPDERKRHTEATRQRRYARHLERHVRGERVRSYDQQWLAFLKENAAMERRSDRG